MRVKNKYLLNKIVLYFHPPGYSIAFQARKSEHEKKYFSFKNLSFTPPSYCDFKKDFNPTVQFQGRVGSHHFIATPLRAGPPTSTIIITLAGH